MSKDLNSQSCSLKETKGTSCVLRQQDKHNRQLLKSKKAKKVPNGVNKMKIALTASNLKCRKRRAALQFSKKEINQCEPSTQFGKIGAKHSPSSCSYLGSHQVSLA